MLTLSFRNNELGLQYCSAQGQECSRAERSSGHAAQKAMPEQDIENARVLLKKHRYFAAHSCQDDLNPCVSVNEGEERLTPKDDVASGQSSCCDEFCEPLDAERDSEFGDDEKRFRTCDVKDGRRAFDAFGDDLGGDEKKSDDDADDVDGDGSGERSRCEGEERTADWAA